MDRHNTINFFKDPNNAIITFSPLSSLEVMILDKYTVVSRDFLCTLHIKEISIDTGKEKITVSKEQNLKIMWEACEDALTCFPVVERYFDEVKIFKVQNLIYLYLRNARFPKHQLRILISSNNNLL